MATSKDSNSGIWVIAALVGIGLVGWLIYRSTKSQPTTYTEPNWRRVSNPPESFIPSGEPVLEVSGGKTYNNTEVREIEYNDDGLPVRITIHRDARVA